MEFKINATSPVHPYVQLADQLREAIAAGEITDMLPSLLELCEQSGLSLSTVQRAMRILKQEGLIHTVPGRGTFVRRGGPAR